MLYCCWEAALGWQDGRFSQECINMLDIATIKVLFSDKAYSELVITFIALRPE